VEEYFLTDDLLRQLMSVGEVDLLVGIATHENAATIAGAVAAIEESFQQNFPRERVVIVNVDCGSKDGTSDLFLNTAIQKNSNGRGLTSLRTEHRVVASYAATASRGLVCHTILASADLLRAKACAIVSPEVSDFPAAWVGNLLQPVYRQNFDFVAPLYARQRYDGLLARTLLYPMSRAIFGRRVRELHSSELGFSGKLASYCLNQDVWHEETVQHLPETWMALSAISSEFECCQSFLGPKPHAASSGTDIVAAIRQTVGTLFWCLESRQSFWMGRDGSEPVPTFGPDHELSAAKTRVNRKRFFELFQSGVAELSPILKSILAADTEAEIQRVASLDERNLCFQNALWVRTLYDFAASYHHTSLNRDHLIQALVPLYRGKMYSFLSQHQDSSSDEIEADCENLCLEFEHQKPYLNERWKLRSEVKI
jgi:glucosylglycerate synthase